MADFSVIISLCAFEILPQEKKARVVLCYFCDHIHIKAMLPKLVWRVWHWIVAYNKKILPCSCLSNRQLHTPHFISNTIIETSRLSGRAIVNEDLVWKSLEQTLQVLGRPISEAIVPDLKSQADDDSRTGTNHIDFSMISESLKKFFGVDTAELIMQRVILRVDELASVATLA